MKDNYTIRILRYCCEYIFLTEEDVNSIEGYDDEEFRKEISKIVRKKTIFEKHFKDNKTQTSIAEEVGLSTTNISQKIRSDISRISARSKNAKLVIAEILNKRYEEFDKYLRNNVANWSYNYYGEKFRKSHVIQELRAMSDCTRQDYDNLIEKYYKKAQFYDLYIADLGLSTRTANILEKCVYANTNTNFNNMSIRRIVKWLTVEKLKETGGCGPKIVSEICEAFRKQGYEIKEK